MRIALGLEYKGTRYYGWQKQCNVPTVQSKLEAAISLVANESINVICAGRTDVGVHANGQVIHFDTKSLRSVEAWVYGVNNYLPSDIRVKWAENVSENFHARFSANARKYIYIIHNKKIKSAIFDDLVAWHFLQLDENAMHNSGQFLLGERDFTSFRSSCCQSLTPMRNIHHLKVNRFGDFIVIDIEANAFLHKMVRKIVGMLITIGEGKKEILWAKEVLEKKDFCASSFLAKASGLYLAHVYYSEGCKLLKNEFNEDFFIFFEKNRQDSLYYKC